MRVKIKSLAAEATIIRREEARSRNNRQRMDLALHRRTVVRSEARSAILAYRCLRGHPYSETESASSGAPNWKRVEHLASRYGARYTGRLDEESMNDWQQRVRDEDGRVREWLAAAEQHLGSGTSADEDPASNPGIGGFDSHPEHSLGRVAQ